MRSFRASCALLVVWWAFLAPARAQAPAEEIVLQPGEYVLEGVRIVGSTYTSPETIQLFSGLAPGVTFNWPSDIFSKAIQKLWQQEILSDIALTIESVEGRKVYIILEVTERPRLTGYSFKGIRSGHANQISEKINFVQGTIFTESKRRDALRIIQNFFQEKGFLDVEAKVDVRYDTLAGNNGVSVVLDIDKGPRVKVRNIYIAGNEALKDKKVRKKLKNTKEYRPGRFWKRSKYQRGSFLEDKVTLIDHYNEKGYRDAEVVEDSISRIPEKTTWFFGLLKRKDAGYVRGLVDLYIKLYEGPRYYFGNITFEGNQKYSDDVLASLLNIKYGEVYDKSLLQKRLTLDPAGLDLSSLYLDDGYLFFSAEPVEILSKGDTIDLEIRIYEGPQATIDKIILEGNETTSDHVILRELRTLPGEKFSRTQLIRSQREILNLGFFDQENMDIVPLPDINRGTVDIKYIVPERSNDQITLQGGWGGVIRDPSSGERIGGGFVATVGLQFNNFAIGKVFERGAWTPIPRGQGQKLSLSVQANGINFQNYAISFLEPWFGGKKPTSLGFSVNYSRQRSPSIDYEFNIIGGSIDLGTRLKWPDDFFTSFTRLSYRNYQFVNAGSIFQGDAEEGLDNGNINIISVRQTLDRSSIDAPIFSRSGSQLTLSVEATPPWSLLLNRDLSDAPQEEKFELLEFYKIKLDVKSYISLTQSKLPLVLVPRVQFGFLGAYDQALGVSPFERFYIGGDGLQGFNIDGREIIQLRGYESEFLGPRTGGTSYAKYTVELRQPITLEQQSMIWIHAFAEAGDAWGSIEDFNPFVVNRSAGVGLRAFLPMFGLLGLDWGYGFDKALVPTGGGFQDISGGRLHFIIGQQF